MENKPIKKKLTLLVDSNVVSKAKQLGLNLSEITEKALTITSLSSDGKKVTVDQLRDSYCGVLKSISVILSKSDLHLKIGSFYDNIKSYPPNNPENYSIETAEFSFYLTGKNKVYLWSDYFDEAPDEWDLDNSNLPVKRFDDPEKIIVSLIDLLIQDAEKNKELLNKLEIVKNIIELIKTQNKS